MHDIATAFILPDDWQIAGNKRVLIVNGGRGKGAPTLRPRR